MSGISINRDIVEDERFKIFAGICKKRKICGDGALGSFVNFAMFYLSKNEVGGKPNKNDLSAILRSGLAVKTDAGEIIFPEDLVYYYEDSRPMFTEN